MAQMVHFGKYDGTTRTHTSTTAVELTDYTISWSNLTTAGFAAGDDVIILVWVCTHASANTLSVSFAVGFGTTFAGRTEETDSICIAEPATADQYFWFDRRTLVTNENIYFRGQLDAAGTARSTDFHCLILKLDDLTANDFLYAEQTHVGNAVSTYDTSGAGASTPASGDWLLFATTRWLIDSTTQDWFVAINDGTSDLSEVRGEGEDTSNERVVGTMAYIPSLGSSVTVRTRYHGEGQHDCPTTKIFGLRMNAFADYEGSQAASTITHSVLDTYQEYAGFGAFGHSVTGALCVLGLSVCSTSTGNQGEYSRIQFGGTSWPTSGLNRQLSGDNGPAGMRMADWTFGYEASRASGTIDIDLDCAEDTATGSSSVVQVAVAFGLELAGAAAPTSLIYSVPSPNIMALLVT